MKKILILVSKSNESKSKFVSLISKELEGKARIELGFFSDISFKIEQGKVEGYLKKVNLSEYDYIYMRTQSDSASLSKSVAIVLEHQSIPYADRARGQASYLGNKLSSLVRLATENVAIQTSIYTAQPNVMLEDIKALGYPIIIKDLKSQRMTGVYAVNNDEELESFIKENASGKGFIYQKYIDIDSEYRILVLDYKGSVVNTRTKRNYGVKKVTYLNPEEWHKFIDINEVVNEKQEAEKGARALLLDVAGVDVCRDNQGKVFLIEVNRGPEIEYDARETKAFADFFMKKAK